MRTVRQPADDITRDTSSASSSSQDVSAVRVMLAGLDYPNPGGVTSAIELTSQALTRAGHDVDLLWPDFEHLGFGIPADLIGPTLLERYWDLRSASLIAAFERAIDAGPPPDVIIATDVVAAHRLMERTSIPVIVTLHGIASAEDVAKGATEATSEAHRYLFGLERSALRNADAVVTVSESLRARLESIHPGIWTRTIQNPVDTDLFRPGDRSEARTKLGWPTEGTVVFCPSRHNDFKGIEHLVAAAPKIDASIMLTEAPPGPLPDNVTVIGTCQHERMRERYLASDLVVIPSVMVGAAGETSSLVAIEAAACGVQVVASAIGGLREVCESLGFDTFAPADPTSLAEAIEDALGRRRDTDGTATRQRAQELHGAESFVAQLLDVVTEATTGRAPLARHPFFHSSATALLAAAQTVTGARHRSVQTLRDNPIADDTISGFMGGLPVHQTELPRLASLTGRIGPEEVVTKQRQRRYWRNPPVERPEHSRRDQPSSGQAMTITYVANRLDPCGGVRILLEHVNRLTDRGHEVTLVAHGDQPAWHPLRARYRSVPLGADWHQYVLGSDVVVSTYWDQLTDLSRCCGTLVYFEQGDFHLYDDLDDATRHHVQENLDSADLVITLSDVARRALFDRYGIESVTVANAIDRDVFHRGDATGTEQRLLIVGSETATFKGIPELVDLWKRMSEEYPGLILDWVTAEQPATPPADPRVRVHVSPDQRELARLYREATVYVSASRYETFPLPPLEAMSSGTAVVSYSNGGVREYAEHERNALLVPIGAFEELIDAVRRVLSDQTLREAIVSEGLETADRYQWEDIMSNLESILDAAAIDESTQTDLDDWTITIADDEFMDPADLDRFRTLLATSTASEIELPVIAEGPPHHLVAHWERLAWRNGGTHTERHLLPVRREQSRPNESQALLMAGDTSAAFARAKDRFAAAHTDGARMESLRWMLFSLIELEQDDAAVSLAREAIAAYPEVSDFAYLAAVIANLTGATVEAGDLRKRVMILGPAIDTPEFLWNIRDLASALPVAAPLTATHVPPSPEPGLAAVPKIVFREPQAAFGTYMGSNRMLIAPRWGGKLIVPADDLSLTPTLVQDGMYDAGLTRFLLAQLEPGDTFVDVGANLGVFSILGALRVGPHGAVYAIEANPELIEVIADNVAINYLQDRVHITSAAAVSAPGSVDLMVTGRFKGESSISPADRDYRGSIESVTVPGIRLDDLEIDGRVRVLKIDVEGAEVEALQGAERLIAQTEWLIVEWNQVVLGDRASAFRDLVGSYVASGARLGVLLDDGSVAESDAESVFGVPFRSGIVLRF